MATLHEPPVTNCNCDLNSLSYVRWLGIILENNGGTYLGSENSNQLVDLILRSQAGVYVPNENDPTPVVWGKILQNDHLLYGGPFVWLPGRQTESQIVFNILRNRPGTHPWSPGNDTIYEAIKKIALNGLPI